MRARICFMLVASVLALVGASSTRSQTPQPIIFFTDITSGPNAGGESVSGFSGAYVTIYGNHFGSSQGSSTITLNGANCLRVVSWGSPWLWYQKIVVQLGSSCASGSFFITVNGQSSASASVTVGGTQINPAAFTVRSGNIYCLSKVGSDSNNGRFPSSCWLTPKHATLAISPGPYMAAGDIVYAEDGVTAAVGGGNYSDTLDAGIGGTAANPIAFIACPQAASNTCGQSGSASPATVTIGTATGDNRGIYECSGYSACPNGNYWVFAGLTIRAVEEPIQTYGAIRIVGNDLSDPNCVGAASGSITMTGSGMFIYGNNIHDTGANTVSSITKLHHMVYVGDGTTAVDAGWNTLQNNHGNRGFQVYCAASACGSGSPSSSDVYDIHVHDNVIANNRGNPLLFNQVNPNKGTLEAYNNVIYNAGTGPDFADGSTSWDCTLTSTNFSTGQIQLYNNTFYMCGTTNSASPSSGCYASGHFNAVNNICYQKSGFQYFDGVSGETCSNNIFYGAGSTPAGCTTGAINTDPAFNNPTIFDFTLAASSPGVDAGYAQNSLTWDHNGVIRPQGSAYDIGAYEYFSGGSTVQKPNPPTGLTVIVQ